MHETPPRTSTLETAIGQPGGQWHTFDWRAADQSIPERVRALARRHPDRLAVFDVTTELTFGALDRAARRVANALLAACGDGPGAVLLLLDVGAAAVVAALGILRAGKHFVGVEPSFPLARIVEIADDAGAAIVLTSSPHQSLAREVARAGRAVIDVDALGDADDREPDVGMALDSMALLNYTSGSTGKPKGVVQSHRSAIAQACRYGNSFRLGAADRLASFGSLAWAGSFWDAFGSLCLGAGVGAYDVRRHGLPALPSWLERTRTTVVSGMTVVRRLAYDFPGLRLPGVRLIQLGGDTVYRRDVETCQRVFPNAILAVGLGTTEAGRIAEQHIAPGATVEHEVVPVGYATPGVRILLLGEDGVEVAPGATGEIVAQSDELAVGYRNRPALTAERFRHDPRFGTTALYYTGDLGRVLPDGSLQHAGRTDFQLKIRGYQIDANEIEALLVDVDGVREAFVTVRRADSGVEQLVAFLVRAAAGSPTLEVLRARLRERVPDYMLPGRFVDVAALPRTPTGKIDRKAMPSMPVSRRGLEVALVAPRTRLEADLATLWAEVLGVDAVGVDDDFLALGGDSLGAQRLAGRIGRDFGLDLPLAALFDASTVAKMAALIAAVTTARTMPPRAPEIPVRGR